MNELQHQIDRHRLWWGTFGKNPAPDITMDDVTWVRIQNLSNAHIVAILETQPQLNNKYRTTFCNELYYRNEHDIVVPECESYPEVERA